MDRLYLVKLGILLLQASEIKAGSYLTLVPVSDVVNPDMVFSSIENVVSVYKCGLDCKTVGATSFYYDGAGLTCHCNSREEQEIQVVNSSSIIYGFASANGTYGPSSINNNNSKECKSLYDQGYRSNGGYTIISGADSVECNFSSLGWVVFQRRFDGNVDFNRSWTDYVNGFGDPDGEFWLGLENIHQATNDVCELNVYLEADNDSVQANGNARYNMFSVDAASTNYTLFANGFSGNVKDSFRKHRTVSFSTPDADHDLNNFISCAERFSSGWWFTSCLNVNLNGLYLGGVNTQKSKGIVWKKPWGEYYSLLRTEMAYRCN